MPRNITVTFADGSNHVYRNAPDDITPDQVTARAQQEFGKPIKSLDGGRKPAAAKPAGKPNVAMERYTQIRDRLSTQFASDPAKQKAALAKFDRDPRTQRLRTLAGLPHVTTPRTELQAAAKRARSEAVTEAGRRAARERQGANTGFTSALGAGIRRGLFGIPERLAAAGLYYSGNAGDLTYDETLQATRAATDEELSRSTGGNIIGQILGGFGGGGVAGKAITQGAGRLASAGAPVVARAGNVLQRLTTLEKGKRLANAGRISLAGAAGGAAQSAGEGSDVGTGAITGAIAAPVVAGGIKVAQGVGRTARAATRPFSSSVPKAIKEVITEAPEAVATRQAELSAQTGGNVPIIAALKDQDFRAVTDKVLKRSPEAMETARGHSGKYLRGFMDRMLSHVNRAGRQGDAQLTSIGELAQLRRDTADDLMGPIAAKEVDLTQLPLDDLERQMTRQIGGRIQGLAPRINEALRDLAPDDLAGMGLDASDVANARKLMTQWGMGTPVTATVKEMDSLRRALDAAGKSAQNSNPANAMAFRNASKAVRDFTTENVPAYGQMVDTYAAQSRMMEGFETAAAGRRLTDIEDDLLRSNLRTPEGRIGMKAGELFRQREAVSGRPTGAIAAARDFASEGKLTRPASLDPGAAQPGTVTENLGDAAAAGLAKASQAETQVLGRMLDTDKLNAMARDEAGALSPEEIVYGAFLGNALASTKARFLATLLDKLPRGFNKKVADNLADMLFSQDAASTKKAMAALQKTGLGDRAVTALMRNALPNNIAVGALAAGKGAPGESAPSGEGSAEADLAGMEDDLAGTVTYEGPNEGEIVEGEESPYAQDLQTIYDTENPELLDLIDRVEQQESGGDQGAVSSTGAVGVMQVMPETAPEAAALAGVPWDEQAYRLDATYNRILGIAYLSEMLRRYDGDVELALAAYNAGPGRADKFASGEIDFGGLPAETQNYILKVAG